MNLDPNTLRVAIDTGREVESLRATPRVADFLHGKPFIILRDEKGAERIEYVTEQVAAPTFRKGVVALQDAASFIAYFKKYATPASAVYASLKPFSFEAVLDEHPAVPNNVVPLPTPGAAWREFRATFAPQHSPEWLAWTARNGKEKPFTSTEDFAFFVEDNAPDFLEPSAAAMLELALNFRVTQQVNFRAVQRLQDGRMDFQYQNVIEGGSAAEGPTGNIAIPETFKLKIPVFAGVGATEVEVEARFRFRLQSGRLTIWYELVRPHKILEAAFEGLWKQVGEGIARPILLGKSG